jgi:hypothetical protein
MLYKYQLDDKTIDSIDLKALIVSRGVKVSNEVYQTFQKTHRIYPDPVKCNCLILPDNTIVQLTDVALHMSYIKSAMNWDTFKNLRYFTQLKTPFKLKMSDQDKPVLLYNDKPVTEVEFPSPSQFYEQKTTNGLPYLGNAVLQGVDTLAFQCLWPCEYAKAGYSCQFCYSGGQTERLAHKNKPDPKVPSTQDIAEITDYALKKDNVKFIEITGGSTFNPQAECSIITDILKEIDATNSLSKIAGEVLVFTTPPSNPKGVDQLFNAGAGRVICSFEVWNQKLAATITPGKIKFITRQRHLDCLKYIAKEYGPSRACSSFVIGLEPIESLLEGMAFLASEGIVPIASVWIPFGRPVMGSMKAPELTYYQQVKSELVEIYDKYDIEPPGGVGFNVCICRDSWLHKSEVKNGTERTKS